MQDTGYKIRAVLFDFGGTLLDFGKVNTTELFRQGARLSYDFLKEQSQPIGNFTFYFWRNLISIRIQYWLSFLTRKDFDTLTLLKKVGSKKGIKLTCQQWQHLAWLWYEPLSRIAQAEPNIAETLSKLKRLGLKLGIVSNTFVNCCCLEKNLEQFGVLDFFTVRLYSYEFDFRKPDPRIFRIAAERIGESPENILFVGDRIYEDVKAAARVGMYAALKVGRANRDLKIPKSAWKIDKLAGLPDLIEKINTATPPAQSIQ
jgi:HAD superfamily hydrolase (TIGR01549 family)